MATNLLAFDFGDKKIGVAVGQQITQTATPLKVIKQDGAMWQQIDALFKTWQPKHVIIGKPELADGKPHPLQKKIERFILCLQQRYNVEVYQENEALTSFEAAEYFQGKNQKKSGRLTRPVLDAHAAAIILESWMRCNEI